MANGHNSCRFEGRIARDPQISTVQTKKGPMTKAYFTLAVDRELSADERTKVKNGDKSVVTADFVTFSAIGGTADFVSKYCPKGKALSIVANYYTYQTTDKNTGQTRYEHVFNVDTIKFAVQDAKYLQNQQQQQNQYNNGYQQQNQYQQQQQQQQYAPQQQYGQQQNQAAPNNAANTFALFDSAQSPF